MKKIIITATITSLVGLLFFIPQHFFSNIIDTFFLNNKKQKIKIEKKLNEFYIPLDILLTSSYNEWKYLNKHNNSLSFWDTFTFKKSNLNVKLKYNKNYRLKFNSIKVSTGNNVIFLNGLIKILDKQNNILGTGSYSKILWFKKVFLLKESLKEGKEIYKIEIFLPYLELGSVVGKNESISLLTPKYPSMSFTIKIRKNIDIETKNKQIVKSVIKFYSTYFLNNNYIAKEEFQLQAENNNEYILSNLTQEKRDKWVKYMLNIFKPYHEKLEKLIYEKQYLIEDKKMKQLLNRLLFHINGYKIVFKQWKQKDYSRLTSDINFPSEINKYTKERITILKKELNSE